MLWGEDTGLQKCCYRSTLSTQSVCWRHSVKCHTTSFGQLIHSASYWYPISLPRFIFDRPLHSTIIKRFKSALLRCVLCKGPSLGQTNCQTKIPNIISQLKSSLNETLPSLSIPIFNNRNYIIKLRPLI